MRAFCADLLHKHLESLLQAAGTARIPREVEEIHRVRVATRRLRSALDVAKGVAPGKRLARWKKAIRRLTRALGSARDADVQIGCLESVLDGMDAAARRAAGPGIRRLLLRRTQQRRKLQEKVARAFGRLHAAGDLADLRRWVKRTLDRGGPQRKSPLRREAGKAVLPLLEKMLKYERYVHQPEAVDMLHELRIAAKRLRYTLEAYAPLFPDRLRPYKDVVKEIQSLLGTVHDDDVWIRDLPEFLKQEERRHEEFQGDRRGMRRLERGIDHFLADRVRHRAGAYEAFVAAWKGYHKSGAWEELRQRLDNGHTPRSIEDAGRGSAKGQTPLRQEGATAE
jgi:CHAD domain-containing protein